ncbi:MAG TPA: FecR domain-containing protein, partial [Chthoniobacteraceae bacterium]|nr:FecR domain-containing protein [Chthoniobacteraceae bacterium]
MRVLRILRRFVFATLLVTTVPVTGAAPLEQAQINRIVSDVRVVDPKAGAHRAALHELIKDDLGVLTGIRSRSELLFQDLTLTRLGAETFFSFKPGTRDMTLDRGAFLLHVPKGRGGARIHAAGITAAITGTTIMIELMPGRWLKVIVLEGSLRLSNNRRLGDVVRLTGGKMVIM